MPAGRFSFRRPGLAVGLASAAGVWWGLSADQSALREGVAALLLCGAGLLAWSGRGWPAIQRPSFLACFAAAGALAGLFADKGHRVAVLDAAAQRGTPTRFVGRIAAPLSRKLAPPRWRSEALQPRLSLLVDVDSVESEGAWQHAGATALLVAEDVPLEANVGDGVEGSARFVAPEGPSNPGEPDQRPRLRRQGVAYLGSLERGALAVTRVSTGIERRAERFRESFTRFVREQLGPGDRAALVAALAVGERSGVSPTLADAFNTSGLAHILSISGLHLAVAVVVLAWVLRRSFALSPQLSARIAPKRLAAIVALPVTVFYVVLIGAPAPAVRAGLGLGLVLLGAALGRDPDVLNTLGWSLAAIVLIDPPSLDDPSTQLSFLGVVGLVYFTERLREFVPLTPPEPGATGWRAGVVRAREAVLLLGLGSVAATLATAPITAINFERASIVAAVANVTAWPASTLIVPAGALAAAVYVVSPTLAGPLVHLAGVCAWGLAWCARFFARWPAAAVRVAPPTGLAIAGYAVLVVALANVRRWNRIRAFSAATLGATLLAAGAWPSSAASGRLEVTFLSVGQGDSTVVRFPHGGTMVVDAGGEVSQRFDPGERIVTPFLRSEGIRKIDVLVATHPHPDHIGGLPALLQRFDVGELWENGEVTEDGPLAALIDAARERHIPVVEFHGPGLPDQCPGLAPLADSLPDVAPLAVGDPRCTPSFPERTTDGVRVQILHPLNGPEKASFPELDENDNSLVLRLTYGRVHVLLSGDIEHEGESLLLGRGVDVSAEIEKAPHHGSRTSSTPEFIKAVHPKYVVFCVGEHNQFGFPAPEVEARYAAAGCQRFRTDEDGAVTFTTDGDRIEVARFKQGDQPAAR
jgi:competence protein ComEC